jgi:Predicted nucleotide-binding protein containing TIR-like domain
MRIFLTHGRDKDAVRRVRSWFQRNYPDIDIMVFTPTLGDPIPTSLEIRAAQADAAIVLASPDDLGSLREACATPHSRARQNVWMELGFFWARLGRHRTLLLLRGDNEDELPEIPTNVAGLAYLAFGNSLAAVSRGLHEFVSNARTLPPEQLTEVVAVSSAFVDRDQEWREIRGAARRELWIVGFAMRSQRRWLAFDLALLREHRALRLIYQVVDPDFAVEHRTALATLHRADAVEDNRVFFGALLRELREHPDVAERVVLQLNRGAPAFAALLSDPPEYGSEILVHPFVPRPTESASDHPRLRLRKRTGAGAYQVYWDAIARAGILAQGQGREAAGIAEIEALLSRTATAVPVSR